jgi:hypothetical protein
MSIYELMKDDVEKRVLSLLDNDYDCGELIPLQEWIGCVQCGAFIDYDGYGELATETQTSNVMISPSEMKGYDFPEWATHIMWYNR